MHVMVASRCILLALLVLLTACAAGKNRTPEQTIERFTEGYRRGDKSMILSTLHERHDVSSIGLGIQQDYRLLQKMSVLDSADPAARAGDIEIRTHRTIKWPDGPVEMIATFQLRRINDEWKIVGYSAYVPQPGDE